jgi:multidrug efflux pump subunit AcrA (membrane-fusion protein)
MNDQLSNDLASLQIDRSAAPSAGSGRRILVGVVLLVAVVGLGFWAKPLIEGAFFATEVEFTEVARMSPAQAAVDLTATGYVIPQTTSKVSVKVGGKISKVHVKARASGESR